jgi:Chlorophyll A-B binding protein
MKSVAIVASLVASAAAFAPAQQSSARSSVATNMAFENELGAQPPLGFFDPLGLVSSGDQEKFDRLRFVEIKHGRIAMLAVAGYLVAESGIRLPGLISYDGTTFADIPNGFAALSAVPQAGVAQIFAFIGFLEIGVMKSLPGTGNEFVGDFRNGYIDYGWNTFSEDVKMKKRAIELNQGRAAQMGILALMVHEKLGVSVLPSP